MTERTPEQIVRDFCAAWTQCDLDELISYFTDDAVYHNMPMPPVQGTDAIRRVFEVFSAPAQAINWEIVGLATDGGTVFTERVDRFEIGDRKVELPVAGVFEIRDGKITAWRDYFDMASWTNQTA